MSKFFKIVPLALLVCACSVWGANIVINPSFESGFTSWNVNLTTNNPWEIVGSGGVGGGQYASTGCVGAACINPSPHMVGSWLYQDLPTVASQTYTLSFFFFGAGNPMEFQVLWGDASTQLNVCPSSGGTTCVEDLLNIGNTTFTQYVISGLVASTTDTRLEFIGRQDPSFDGLDNVCVDLSSNTTCNAAIGGVPEPSSLAMAGSALIGLAFLGFRRRRRS